MAAQATVACAHAIARVVYRMLKYKVEYDQIDVTEYEKKYEEQQIKYMKKKAAKLGRDPWRGGEALPFFELSIKSVSGKSPIFQRRFVFIRFSPHP